MLSSQDRTMMRAVQADLYHDTCQVCTYTDSDGDSWGYGQPTYTAQAAISCGFKPASVREVMDSGQVAMTVAQLRLPVDTEVTALDRIRLTHRHGAELDDAEVYAIKGIKRGPSGLVLELETCTEEDVRER
jgi:hypothetical protein